MIAPIAAIAASVPGVKLTGERELAELPEPPKLADPEPVEALDGIVMPPGRYCRKAPFPGPEFVLPPSVLQ